MAVQTPVNHAAPAIPGINRAARDSLSTEDSSSAPSHLSISAASSSGLDGSLAGFSLFGNPVRPAEGLAEDGAQSEQQRPQQGTMTRTLTHRVLPTNGLFGSAAFAARATAGSGARHDASLSHSTTTGGESSVSVDASFPNRLQTGSDGQRWGGSNLAARFTIDMAPPPIPAAVAASRAPPVGSDLDFGPPTPTRNRSHNARSGSSSTQREGAGGDAFSTLAHSIQQDAAGPSSTLSQTEATFSQTASGDSAEGPQSQRYPTNSTSAESSVEYAVQLLQQQGLLAAQTPPHVLPSSTPALPAFLPREPSARSLAAGRDQRLKAHVQIGLAVPSHKAPPLDPSVYSSQSGLTPFPILTSSTSSSQRSTSRTNTNGTESHPMLGIPLPSPAETASLRHRAYLAQRQNILRDNLARANVLTELDQIAQEQDRDKLRASIEKSAALWRADRERARRGEACPTGDGTEADSMEDGSRSTPSTVTALGESTASNQSNSAATGGYPSAMSSAQQISVRDILRSSPGPDGKATSSVTRRNAVAMLTNEGRSALQYLASEIAETHPLVAEWAYALPAPGGYNAPLIAAQRVRRTGTHTPAAAPPRPAPRGDHHHHQSEDDAPKIAGGRGTEEPGEEEGAGLRLSTTFLLSGQVLSSEMVTASAAIASNKMLFTSRQAGAEIGTMASTWDAGPGGKRLRGVYELERCGWSSAAAATAAAALASANAEEDQNAMMGGTRDVCWGGARRP